MMRTTILALLLLACPAAPKLHADVAVLVGEPYGHFGSLIPTGHAAVYLNRVCAATPVRLRRCDPGELGVVISRYHKVTEYDWVAIPLLPYLYAVERSSDVPAQADRSTVKLLRDRCRRRYLRDLVPDGPQGQIPRGEWIQLVGAAYDRRVFAFEIETTPAQDDAFIAAFNARENKARFNLFRRNCADFARNVINFYYPKSVRRSFIADLGITTPKQVARSLVRYRRKHPELRFTAFIIPQIPGSQARSRGVRGVLESLVMSKKYAVPLTLVNLWLTPALAAGYVTTGRFNPARYAVIVHDPTAMEERALLSAAAPPAAGGLAASARSVPTGN